MSHRETRDPVARAAVRHRALAQRTASDPAAAGRRLAGLDGLRAIAVAMVILYHVLPGTLPGGFIGVDVFFVVSGFIITYLLIGERARGTVRLGAFWLRRARRLLPALVVLVFACCAAALAIGGDVLVGLGQQVLGAFTFSSNWIFIAQDQSYFTQASPQLFRNLWSLAVEEQFYLVWPFVALLLIAFRFTWLRASLALTIAVASGLLMAVLYTPGADPSRVYYGSDTHAFGLAIGAALAFLVVARRPFNLGIGETGWQAFERRHSGWLGIVALAGLVACAVLMTDQDPFVYRGGLVLVAVLTAIVIWASTRPRALLGRVIDIRPLRAVGVRSYGLYLWHWPVFILVEAALRHWPRSGLGGLGLAGIALSITVIAAWLSYWLIETPIRKRGFGVLLKPFRTAEGRPSRLVAGVLVSCLVVAGGVATGFAVTAGHPETAAQRQIALGQQAIAAAKAKPIPQATPTAAPTTPVPTPATTASAAPTPSPTGPTVPPYPPTPQSGADITAIGDSVMLAAAPALEQAFPGIAIDAVVSRSPRDAPALITAQAQAGTLRQIVVIGLGTNGYLGTGTLAADRAAAGPGRALVFVNIYANEPWQPEVDTDLAAFVRSSPPAALADWHDAIAADLNLLGPDQVHPGAAGGQLYAACVAQAIGELPTVG